MKGYLTHLTPHTPRAVDDETASTVQGCAPSNLRAEHTRSERQRAHSGASMSCKPAQGARERRGRWQVDAAADIGC